MTSIVSHILDGTPSDVVARYESLPGIAERCDFGVLDRNVVVVDTETTGLSFSHDELIQIAAAKMERGTIVGWFVTFVNPGKALSEDIVHLTNIHDDDLEDAPSPDEALAGLAEFAGDAIMVAHNAEFDKTFVTKHPAGYPLLENIWVDSLDLSRIALPRLKSHRLIDLVHTFGAPVSTHRADDDVAATCVIFRILLAAVSSMPTSLVEVIGNFVPQDEWPTGFVFREIARQKIERDSISDTNELQKLGCQEPKVVSRETNVNENNASDRELNERIIGTSLDGYPKATPAKDKPFSVYALRRRRMTTLPARRSRKDAEELVGQLEYPSRETLDRAFTPEGTLGSIYEGYEPRNEQREMAQSIRDAFEASENLVVEAGTGVGKSMAYLLPAALFAKQNGVAVGVATKTNSLLDQLVFQELPALAQALQEEYPHSEPLTWAALKGMSHYPCLRKVSRMVENGPGKREVTGKMLTQAPALAGLLSFIEQSEFDDMDSLKIDYRALPRYAITTKSGECLRRKCPFFGKLCFVHGARRRAETADILVTNHTLLFCDVAADGGLLPTARHWIVDEAHATEAEARQAFAATVDSEEISRIVSRVADWAGARNVFAHAERSVGAVAGEQLTLFYGLVSKARSSADDFVSVADDYQRRIKDLLYFDPTRTGRKSSQYDHVDIWINDEVRRSQLFADVAAVVADLVEKADKFIKTASDVVAYLEGIEEAAVAQREIASTVMDVRDVRNAAELIFSVAPETYAYQATLHRKKDRKIDKVQAMLLHVGDKMNETFYASTHSVVFASATLTVGGKFDPFETALGLNAGEFSHTRELQLDSSYDFDNNMIIYVVSDMPEPTEPGYAEALNDLLVQAHRAQQGSMLTLFTNRREMERAYAAVAPALKPDDLRVVCQKYGVSVKGLRDDFLADEHLSLFALKSFWEGFDAPGATLKGVIIPKLPFGRPTDPLYCERAARDDRAWWHYVLPQAVIETKQAAGRLIRKADDHGVLILADKRLITKRYGKTFLGSLQSKTVRVCTREEIVSSLRVLGTW